MGSEKADSRKATQSRRITFRGKLLSQRDLSPGTIARAITKNHGSGVTERAVVAEQGAQRD